ncbi:GNAT family N-acetyltransferase [Psychrobacillus lasiicapitis]|uniref:GNAT family N-acetyltransferase n=1 Tax=Psychrobacillus lasiicapitis TaxID=1636719 RepID=A0A544SWI4_9BACI|nr:GNAT family N-acetyltransferase [Psychrobacillus lasiicapitis]TQR09574.1 GNAT family N-acetyltransferase [Psychrobacillus lasiicapitis]GGA29316.1 N-acetyltransferase [Psychrobacillus lasiicapitis]
MVKLVLMNSEEYQKYITSAIKSYAIEKVLSGNWNQEESIRKAEEEYTRLLPIGEKTESNYLYTILNDDKAIGVLWLARKSEKEGFIYDISILEQYQGFGYAKETMTQIEIVGKELGMNKIGLHVFGHNKVARGLYEKLGYQTTNVLMEKEI